MRILFVTPYPPSRIRVRGYGFLAQLQQCHEVTIVAQCFSEQEEADAAMLQRQGYEVIVVREARRSALVRSARALADSCPLQVAYACSPSFEQQVRQLLTQRVFDVIHVEHLRGIASMTSLIGRYPLVWDAVDCISLLSEHTMRSGPDMKVRAVAALELKRTRRYEAQLLKKLPTVIVTSERDRQAMLELVRSQTTSMAREEDVARAEQSISVLPNGVDLDYFQFSRQERQRYNLVFSGKMSYHANVATALYLYQQVMPLIWSQRPEVTLTIVGSKPPRAIRRLANDPRVEVTGYVEDMRTYVGRAEVMVSPMVYSVGIQNKVLEAMALGTPVVVAKQAASALAALPERDLLVAESAQEVAAATVRLLENTALRADLQTNGRSYVEQHHHWRTSTEALTILYQKSIDAFSSGVQRDRDIAGSRV